jgi:hypothetical protein
MTDGMTSQNIDLSSWDTLYKRANWSPYTIVHSRCKKYVPPKRGFPQSWTPKQNYETYVGCGIDETGKIL